MMPTPQPAWIKALRDAQANGPCLTLPEAPLPGHGTALALAPHPDDPDAVAVTLRLLQQGGWALHWLVVSTGWSGVPDDLVGPDRGAKARLREAEERTAAARFGLPDDRLVFLRLAENDAGELDPGTANRNRLLAALDALAPGLVLLPHGADSNPDHRLVFAWFAAWQSSTSHSPLGLGNEDPKTQAFAPSLVVEFGEETAAWKARLLECHCSQSLRNQRSRGHTFAERILAVNRRGLPAGRYAERFACHRTPDCLRPARPVAHVGPTCGPDEQGRPKPLR